MRGRSFLVVCTLLATFAAIASFALRARHRSEPAATRPADSHEPASAPASSSPPLPARALATRQVATDGATSVAPSDETDSMPAGFDRSVPSAGVLLHVVDAQTKLELDDVTLLRQELVGAAETPHPGAIESREIVARGRSPLRVLPRVLDRETERVTVLWVGAPDHAWGIANLEYLFPGERTVELLPAAALVVDLQGRLPEPHVPADAPLLRLRRPPPDPGRAGRADRPGDLIAELPARLGAMSIDGLAPGEITASVEIGLERWTPLVVGCVAAMLVEHQTTHVTLVLAPIERPEPVPLAGTLFVPEVWSQHRFALLIRPLDLVGPIKSDFHALTLEQMPEIADRPGWRRFSAGRVHPATYHFEIDTFGFSQAITVAPPGDENVELIVSDAATVIVRVVDAASGEPLALNDLYWQSGRDPGHSHTLISFHHRGDDRCFEATVPTGPGAVFTDSYEWILDDPSARAEIHAGSQELIVRARKACGLFLEYMRDGKPADPLDDRYLQATLEAVDHDGNSPNQMFESGVGFTFFCTAPGRYRVTIPQVPGDEPIAPFEVDLPAATIVTQVVELKRAR